MGLDVYLERCKDFAAAAAREEEYNNRADEIWNQFGKLTYEQMTDDQKKKCRAACKKLCEKMGLSQFGRDPSREKIEIDSEIYPKHMFKIGYFRSSYNSGGINDVLRKLGLPDLYFVFQPPKDGSGFFPDWKNCLIHAKELLEQYRQKREQTGNIFTVDLHHLLMFGQSGIPQSIAEAVDAYTKKRDEHNAAIKKNGHPGYDAFSCREGDFWMGEPLKVVAAIPYLNSYDNLPSTVLICQKAESESDWYEEALEVVIETCEWALIQPDAANIRMIWSS